MVFRFWRSRIGDFLGQATPSFSVVEVFDPGNPHGRPPARSWWPTESIRDMQIELQEHLYAWPGTTGPLHPTELDERNAPLETLEYLWDGRQNEELVCAVMLCASFFPRMDSRRHNYPSGYWPPQPCAALLRDWAYRRWAELAAQSGTWHPLRTTVLPYSSEDFYFRLDSMGALVRYLAEEHAVILLNHSFVEIRFADRPAPFVEKVLRQKADAHRAELAASKAEQEREDASQRERDAERRQQHLRWGEWRTLKRSEFERLVWSQPLSEIAQLFGVSSAEVSRRCEESHVVKPPRGFWQRVKAGKISHPNGKPVTD
jgi:hypothetical protein